MQVTVENTGSLGRTLKVSLPKITFDNKRKQQMQKVAATANLKGFRKGHVPDSVLEKRFGQSIDAEVTNELVRESLADALAQEKLQPVAMPKVKELKVEQGLEYTAEFEIFPKISEVVTGSISVEKKIVKVQDSDISKMLDKLREQNATYTLVARAAQDGDRITADYERLILDDIDAKVERQTDSHLFLGKEGTLPELNQGLLGKEQGFKGEFEFTYPETYGDKKAAGKKVRLTVTIKEVAEKNAATDEALCKTFAVNDMDELKKQLFDRMTREAEYSVFNEVKETVLEQLLSYNKVELPNSLVEMELKSILRSKSQDNNAKIVLDDASEEVRKEASDKVALGLLVNELINKYEVKASAELVRAEVERRAMFFPDPNYLINAYYANEKLLQSVENAVLVDEVVRNVLTEAKVIEKEINFDDILEKQA